ncbi:uncharacterized protein HKW66_Vig0159510 [Vigna angularis]|uniref:Uncharacterized protein n=1 Tax=Phaseolus angularis TaxID=3914 RepID=A0A8T0JMN7_PHAAN|nr:uncharacterized protein HKW66_Vig0159510 [Vigna angularis]
MLNRFLCYFLYATPSRYQNSFVASEKRKKLNSFVANEKRKKLNEKMFGKGNTRFGKGNTRFGKGNISPEIDLRLSGSLVWCESRFSVSSWIASWRNDFGSVMFHTGLVEDGASGDVQRSSFYVAETIRWMKKERPWGFGRRTAAGCDSVAPRPEHTGEEEKKGY